MKNPTKLQKQRKAGERETKRSKSLPHFHRDSVSLAEELWHQLAGWLPPLGRAWVKRRGRDHPACATHCFAALYTSLGLQQLRPKACRTGGTVGLSEHWYWHSVKGRTGVGWFWTESTGYMHTSTCFLKKWNVQTYMGGASFYIPKNLLPCKIKVKESSK